MRLNFSTFFQFQKSQTESRSKKRNKGNNTVYIKGKNFSTVFILGAGATRGAIRHVIFNRKRVKPPLNSDFFKIALTYAQAQGKNAADNRRLKRLNLFFRDYLPTKRDNLSMETAFSLLFMAKDFPQIYAAEREEGTKLEIDLR
jgi:hypothetical protein